MQIDDWQISAFFLRILRIAEWYLALVLRIMRLPTINPHVLPKREFFLSRSTHLDQLGVQPREPCTLLTYMFPHCRHVKVVCIVHTPHYYYMIVQSIRTKVIKNLGVYSKIYTVFQQKTSPTFLAITRESIDRFFIIFGRNVTEKASNHMLLHFPTSPNYCFYTTLWNWKHGNCMFSRKCFMLICQ